MKRRPGDTQAPRPTEGGRNAIPPVTPAEITEAARRAGLTLNPGQQADLALAWGQFVGLVADISRHRPLVDDFAHRFLLPPPADAAPARQARKGS